MKKIIITLLTAIITSASFAQQDADTKSLKGPFKHVIAQDYIDTIQTAVNKDKSYREYFFAPDGKLTEVYNYNNTNSYTKHVYEYDEHRNHIKTTMYIKKKDEELTPTAMNVYRYDEQNRMIDFMRFEKGANAASYGSEYEYIEKKGKTKKLTHNFKKGRLYNGTNVEVYDKNGNLVENRNFYDRAMKKEHPSYSKFTYNKANQCTKRESIPLSQTENWEKYEYNEQGDVVEFVLYSYLGESTSKYEYEYDSHNNWILQHKGYGPTKRKIGVVRFIEYYD